MIQCLTQGLGHIISKPRWKVFTFLAGGSHGALDLVFGPFRDKSLTGFTEKGIVFIPAVRPGLSNRINKNAYEIVSITTSHSGARFFLQQREYSPRRFLSPMDCRRPGNRRQAVAKSLDVLRE